MTGGGEWWWLRLVMVVKVVGGEERECVGLLGRGEERKGRVW